MQEEITDGWSDVFDDFVARFAGRFGRVESRRRVVSYVRGLLSETERKNGWTLAETVGDDGPQGMQRVLNHYVWDAEALRDDVRDAVVELLGDPEQGILILDETGFLKKGVRSAGVARQYSGTAGRIENSQIGVFLAYGSEKGRALIDRELYLPKGWTSDRQRCRAAGIEDDVEFATKPDLGLRMLQRAVEAGIPFGWVTADEVYGQTSRIRLWLEEHEIPHVLVVPKSQMVITMEFFGQARAHELISQLADDEWKTLNCGNGAHGPRVYDWAAAPIRPWRREGWDHWLLARRSLTDPTDIAYYICFSPTGTPLEELVRIAGSRWMVEECFQAAKNETGLDHYQVRGYTAWYRHITLSMAALAFLAILRAEAKRGSRNR
ncbi:MULTISPECIES: IS701 family transposase [unclassified Streptomyces]|uniref:IS701 family transposase n=1 Tax=unclassified Streptomyces TaxID=2593676 RepID=UPI002254D174|nr:MULTISPECIES: IS701 family transposase [unclassified Streptomyces]WSP55561.1 IS701 family transposase [Streptomyces sp. NBC_01241]MCX4787255.1 IS701 family transposase [Streptomyces sp. NBC_01221]MCX4796962.1 IS701 family transposase [Streptomyces sp. NBC_01242]WSJ38275.1 IS701 family transposase [Streptomyces sp. NBC_01321]WSP64563.1 IS701 family transposase [Streptomyces sp. NBC_01240]